MPLLRALHPCWTPLFAVALYTGLRKGELLGLRKEDVDLRRGLLTVARPYARETTKGGHADTIPAPTESLPWLEEAIRRSQSALVFPRPDGSMMRSDVPLESVLRRAMGRAGLTTGYVHVCRAQGCRYVEPAPDGELRRCPKHGRKLWPKPQVRPLRFHDLRHSTASLLLLAGVPLVIVQRVLRHKDPKLTERVYGHLTPGYLRAEVDRLRFFAESPASQLAPARAEAAGDFPSAFGPPVVHGGPAQHPTLTRSDSIPMDAQALAEATPAGLEPATPGFEGRCSIQMSYGAEALLSAG